MYNRTSNAQFGIEKVRYDSRDTIAEVLVWKRLSDNRMSRLGWHSRQSVIDNIKQGQTYMTIKIDASRQTWHAGEDVHVVKTRPGEYLRTDRNETPKDNLGNLPVG